MFELDDSASRLLERLARLTEMFRDIELAMRARSDVGEVTSSLDVRTYPNGTVVELFVEAALRPDVALVWWLDLWWRGGQWIAEAQVLRNELDGQVVVRQYDAVTAVSFEQVEPGLDRLGRALQDAASDPAALLAAPAV